MKEEEHTSARQGDSSRGEREPFIVGITDGVDAGYQALEYVLAGLRESLRVRRPGWTGWMQQGVGARRTGARGVTASGAVKQSSAQGSRGEGPLLEFDYLVRVAADLLGSASAVAHEFARYVGDRTDQRTEPETPTLIPVEGVVGKTATAELRVHNTELTALQDVEFIPTKLIGETGRIPADHVDFEPRKIERVRPGGWITTLVTVEVPQGADPGTYRGLIQAEPGSAWAVLELSVAEPPDEPEKVTAEKSA